MADYDYDLVAIGGGTAGLTVTRLVAATGKRVALAERDRPGGDCLYTGCVPTKALIAAAKALHTARSSSRLGVTVEDARLDYGAVREHVVRAQAAAGEVDSPEAIAANGVDLIRGEASFRGPHTIEAGGRRLTARNIVIATGAASLVPSIPGLVEAEPATNVELIEWERLPDSLVVIGGGPIGLELAQAMARFGVEVSVIEALPRLLAVGEPEASSVIEDCLRREGVRVETGAKVARVERTPAGRRVVFQRDGTEAAVEGEELLVATGRRPELGPLALDRAGVTHDRSGVPVDKRLRSSQPHIFAAGDVVAGGPQFTHVAEDQARAIAGTINGTRFFGAWNGRVVPRVTYTDPEVASVGLTAAEARERRKDVRVWDVPLSEVDRALTMDETRGFIRVVTARGWQRFVPGLSKAAGDEIVGATIVSANAGDLLAPLVVAMRLRLPAGLVAWNMQPYPTLALGVRQALGKAFERDRR